MLHSLGSHFHPQQDGRYILMEESFCIVVVHNEYVSMDPILKLTPNTVAKLYSTCPHIAKWHQWATSQDHRRLRGITDVNISTATCHVSHLPPASHLFNPQPASIFGIMELHFQIDTWHPGCTGQVLLKLPVRLDNIPTITSNLTFIFHSHELQTNALRVRWRIGA